MNAFDFSPVSCFPNGSPDVWYKFRGTGNYVYIELFGYGDLDTMFVKFYHSNGTCVGLLPGHCETTYNGVIMASILTPNIGGEYYMQIGGGTYDETGNFMFSIKSFNDCSDCVKDSHIELSPAPWFGRYGTSDTVTMCYTVDRWDVTTTSKLHSVIPLFGDEWDTTTLTPLSMPPGNWIWGNNIPTPIGSYDGFYFDSDLDGDPTNNPGQSGNIFTSWEFCWSISTKPYCNAYDAHVQVFTYSDDQTGNGNSLALCSEAVPTYISLSGWCCPDPNFSVITTGGCATFAQVIVDPVSVNSTDTFNITVYDDTLGLYAYQGNVTSLASFTLGQGNYLFEVHNASTGCPSFHVINIPGPFEIDVVQTVIGCGAGSGSAIATPVGGLSPYTYVWPTITTYTDSLAFSLSQGFYPVEITDAMGCTVRDSVFINVVPMPGAYFDYPDQTRCHDEDTIQTIVDPFTLGGTWQLVSPLSSPITVDNNDGTIYLNNCSLATPYMIVVRYTVGSVCTDTYSDSIQIVQRPPAPTALMGLTQDWCIGSTVPTLGIAFQNGIPNWYGLQTSEFGVGFNFQPSLNSSTAAGQYLYAVAVAADLSYGCVGSAITYTINAIAPPVFTMSPNVTICTGDTAGINALGSGTYVYSWSPPPTIGPQNLPFTSTSPAGTTTYTVAVSDLGCISTGFVTVTVDSSVTCGEVLYNGITPNGDGRNDEWIIDAAYNSRDITVSIFNRWGDMVWKGNNYDNSWIVFRGRDGKGDALPSGTYYYTIQQPDREPIAGWLEITR
jgi:gliding motility-associated-like protein